MFAQLLLVVALVIALLATFSDAYLFTPFGLGLSYPYLGYGYGLNLGFGFGGFGWGRR